MTELGGGIPEDPDTLDSQEQVELNNMRAIFGTEPTSSPIVSPDTPSSVIPATSPNVEDLITVHSDQSEPIVTQNEFNTTGGVDRSVVKEIKVPPIRRLLNRLGL